ncbi:unnamed protein product [Chilo suppressalis]|uniref:Major facilitator superfamily (MFS) profile domain-containing protein n=1 Tax=Chilo suppressalis TaxID=168631 RepID=A0ABN8AXV5_CHISP|nr:hypothetical protein evm_001435 [Chilo suppressalis]CAH0399853.1 unnamed protein product [Chilo suppressalis]
MPGVSGNNAVPAIFASGLDRYLTSGTEAAQRVDLIQKITGAFGKYQLFLCLLVFASKIPIAFHQMAIIFLAPQTPYTCDGKPNVCPCPNPVYDRSIFNNTIISEWDLICGNRWLTSFSQTLFQLGTLLGSVFFGMASDRFGRKIPMLVAVVVQIALGIGAAFAPNYWTFSIMRLIVGITVGGTMVIGFVIVMEFMGPQYRDVVSAVYQIPFNLGHMLLPLFGYFFRDYSNFQLAISLPTLVLLSYLCLLPETPRWLIAVHRTDEAVKILERVAKVNNLPTDNIKTEVEAYERSLKGNTLKKGTIVDLVRTPNLRKNIIVMSINWLACSYFFYGVSQYVGQLSGDVFINVAASASVTLLGTLFSIPLLKAIGRKTILLIFNFVSAFSLLLLIAVPQGAASVICASIGVVASFIVFVVVYLYCSELFPTVVRNAALGVSSMMARVGSMIAPFVIDLKLKAYWLPPLVFAVMPLIAGSLSLLLPETKGCKLMTTIEEGERFGKKIKSTSDEKR